MDCFTAASSRLAFATKDNRALWDELGAPFLLVLILVLNPGINRLKVRSKENETM
jgi:hypothetical protein